MSDSFWAPGLLSWFGQEFLNGRPAWPRFDTRTALLTSRARRCGLRSLAPDERSYIRLSSVLRVPRELRSTATLLPFRRGVCAQSRLAKGKSWDGEALLPARERTPRCEPRRVRPC